MDTYNMRDYLPFFAGLFLIASAVLSIIGLYFLCESYANYCVTVAVFCIIVYIIIVTAVINCIEKRRKYIRNNHDIL